MCVSAESRGLRPSSTASPENSPTTELDHKWKWWLGLELAPYEIPVPQLAVNLLHHNALPRKSVLTMDLSTRPCVVFGLQLLLGMPGRPASVLGCLELL